MVGKQMPVPSLLTFKIVLHTLGFLFPQHPGSDSPARRKRCLSSQEEPGPPSGPILWLSLKGLGVFEHISARVPLSPPASVFSLFKEYYPFLFKKLFYCCSITVVCIPRPLLPSQTHLPPSLPSTLLLGFVHVCFIVVPENPSPIIATLLPSGYCQTVLISMSLLEFCLLFFFC